MLRQQNTGIQAGLPGRAVQLHQAPDDFLALCRRQKRGGGNSVNQNLQFGRCPRPIPKAVRRRNSGAFIHRNIKTGVNQRLNIIPQRRQRGGEPVVRQCFSQSAVVSSCCSSEFCWRYFSRKRTRFLFAIFSAPLWSVSFSTVYHNSPWSVHEDWTHKNILDGLADLAHLNATLKIILEGLVLTCYLILDIIQNKNAGTKCPR